jgi:hypothetical protein
MSLRLASYRPTSAAGTAIAGVLASVLCLPLAVRAQDRDRREPEGAVRRIEPGALITVRADEPIEVRSRDGRVFAGVVEQGVPDETDRLAIPRGSDVELVVRAARDGDLILDLDSVMMHGQRYAIRADADRVDAPARAPVDRRPGEVIGGGAVLGTLIGAIAGGGKGAVIGAAAGAVAGAAASGELITQGRTVRVPRGALLTFRLERPLDVGVPDDGYSRDGRHFHR